MNRRSRTRFKTDLTVHVTSSDIPCCTSRARLADLSVHGLSLIMHEELNIGSLVKVEWGSVTFMGELIYCQPHGKEFIVGLKVDDPVYETARRNANQ
jgi:hypothetical protein